MGILYLQTYAKLVGALQEVKLTDEIKKFSKNKKEKPVIVIDGINLMFFPNKGKSRLSWIAGGHLHETTVSLKCVIETLKSANLDIVVFMDGPNWMSNPEGWALRRRERIDSIHDIFDKINEGATTIEIDKIKFNKLPNNIWTELLYILKKNDCKVINSIDECDYEIAAYAKENNCFGIMANDTDFIVNSSCEVYCTMQMDLENMTILKYDRQKLLSELNLDIHFLPLLATLVGNDIMAPFSSINMFWQSYCNNKGSVDIVALYNKVVRYIKILRTQEFSETILKKIAWDVFHDLALVDVIRKSLESYNVSLTAVINAHEKYLWCENKNWSEILKKVYDFHVNKGETSRFFMIISRKTYQASEHMEDFRESDLGGPISEILKPLRKKIYGLLLHECPGHHIVEEKVVKSPDNFEPELVEASPIQVYHPGLLSLWSTKNCNEVKLRLLGDVCNIDYLELKKLFLAVPPELIVPALALKYIVGKIKVADWEVKSAVLSAIIVGFMNVADMSTISLTRVSSRPVRLFSLITGAYGYIIFIIEALGNLIPTEKILPSNFQNGNIFHINYKMLAYGDTSSTILNRGFGVYLKSNIEYCGELENEIMSFIYEEGSYKKNTL